MTGPSPGQGAVATVQSMPAGVTSLAPPAQQNGAVLVAMTAPASGGQATVQAMPAGLTTLPPAQQNGAVLVAMTAPAPGGQVTVQTLPSGATTLAQPTPANGAVFLPAAGTPAQAPAPASLQSGPSAPTLAQAPQVQTNGAFVNGVTVTTQVSAAAPVTVQPASAGLKLALPGTGAHQTQLLSPSGLRRNSTAPRGIAQIEASPLHLRAKSVTPQHEVVPLSPVQASTRRAGSVHIFHTARASIAQTQSPTSPARSYRVTTTRQATGTRTPMIRRTQESSNGQSPRHMGAGRLPTLLAFGDSLTVGAMVNKVNHPYSNIVKRLLGPSWDVVTAGWSGDPASGMGARLSQELAAGRQRQRPFTHVAILGGSNDLRDGASSEKLLQNLASLHQQIRDAGANVIAVTVPTLGPKDYAFGGPCTDRRNRVNAGLRAAAAAAAEGRPGAPPLLLADFDKWLSRLDSETRNGLFSDNIHFTERGYDYLGLVIHGVISQQSAAQAAAQPSASGAANAAAVRSDVKTASPLRAQQRLEEVPCRMDSATPFEKKRARAASEPSWQAWQNAVSA